MLKLALSAGCAVRSADSTASPAPRRGFPFGTTAHPAGRCRHEWRRRTASHGRGQGPHPLAPTDCIKTESSWTASCASATCWRPAGLSGASRKRTVGARPS